MTSSTHANAEELASGLLSVIGPLRRLLRRRVQDDWPVERLPAAQLDLVRLVGQQPGIGVADAASQLRLAPNTVSTLVRQLVAADLLRRAARPAGRSLGVPLADARRRGPAGGLARPSSRRRPRGDRAAGR